MEGAIEITRDVILRVENFRFLVDSVIMHMEEELKIQVIMSRPFLATNGTLIDVLQGTIALRVREEKVTIRELPCTIPSPQYPTARSLKLPPIKYHSSKVYPTEHDTPPHKKMMSPGSKRL